MKKVITYGSFDTMHRGHISLLKRARALGDYLIVGLTSDDYDMARGKINNRRSLEQRRAALESTGLADMIITEYCQGQKRDDIIKYGADIFTLGSDWEGKFDCLRDLCQVIYLPRTEGISSSVIRCTGDGMNLAFEGDPAFAAEAAAQMKYIDGMDCRPEQEADCVCVRTAGEGRFQAVKEALERGRHVLCRLPAAQSLTELESLYALADEKGLILCENTEAVCSGLFYYLSAMVKSGRIGELVSVDSAVSGPEDIFSRLVSALLPPFLLLGSECEIKSPSDNTEKSLRLQLSYPGAPAAVKTMKAPSEGGELIIKGSLGSIYVPSPWLRSEYFIISDSESGESSTCSCPSDGSAIRRELAEFSGYVHSGGRKMRIPRALSRETVKILERSAGGEKK